MCYTPIFSEISKLQFSRIPTAFHVSLIPGKPSRYASYRTSKSYGSKFKPWPRDQWRRMRFLVPPRLPSPARPPGKCCAVTEMTARQLVRGRNQVLQRFLFLSYPAKHVFPPSMVGIACKDVWDLVYGCHTDGRADKHSSFVMQYTAMPVFLKMKQTKL
jgi:hypothetical protein